MVIGNRCGNIRAPDAVQAYSGIGRGGLKAREHCSSSSNAAVVSVFFAPVAQLDRAPGYEPGGREFESLRAHQISFVRSVTWRSYDYPALRRSQVVAGDLRDSVSHTRSAASIKFVSSAWE